MDGITPVLEIRLTVEKYNIFIQMSHTMLMTNHTFPMGVAIKVHSLLTLLTKLVIGPNHTCVLLTHLLSLCNSGLAFLLKNNLLFFLVVVSGLSSL